MNAGEASLKRVIERGCWSEIAYFPSPEGWLAGAVAADGSFEVAFAGRSYGRVHWDLLGEHNRLNALAAIAAAHHAGVEPAQAVAALRDFRSVKRRMEVRGQVRAVTVYDDFAHHPTAIATTIAGLRAKVGAARILAVLEPRSNTMKLGTMKAALPASLAQADLVFGYGAVAGKDSLGWDLASALAPLGAKASTYADIDRLAGAVVRAARAGDHVLVMSNGGFGDIHRKILDGLA